MALSTDWLSTYIDEVQNKKRIQFGIDPNFANKKLNKKNLIKVSKPTMILG